VTLSRRAQNSAQFSCPSSLTDVRACSHIAWRLDGPRRIYALVAMVGRMCESYHERGRIFGASLDNDDYNVIKITPGHSRPAN